MATQTFRNPDTKRTVVYRDGRYSVRVNHDATHTTDDPHLQAALRSAGFQRVREPVEPRSAYSYSKEKD